MSSLGQRRLSDTFGRRLQPEEQSQRVTLEDMKSDLLSETEPAEEVSSGSILQTGSMSYHVCEYYSTSQ